MRRKLVFKSEHLRDEESLQKYREALKGVEGVTDVTGNPLHQIIEVHMDTDDDPDAEYIMGQFMHVGMPATWVK